MLGWEGGTARAARQVDGGLVDVGQVKWAQFPSMREGTGRWEPRGCGAVGEGMEEAWAPALKRLQGLLTSWRGAPLAVRTDWEEASPARTSAPAVTCLGLACVGPGHKGKSGWAQWRPGEGPDYL